MSICSATAFSVCPVTEPMYYERESRAIDREKLWNCYLPAGTKWYDFHTLKEYEGGTEVEADASIGPYSGICKGRSCHSHGAENALCGRGGGYTL